MFIFRSRHLLSRWCSFLQGETMDSFPVVWKSVPASWNNIPRKVDPLALAVISFFFFRRVSVINSTRNGDKNHPQWNLFIFAGHLLIGGYTLQGTNIPQKWHLEDDFPFPKVGYVNPWRVIFHSISVTGSGPLACGEPPGMSQAPRTKDLVPAWEPEVGGGSFRKKKLMVFLVCNRYITRWWFQIFFMFIPIWDKIPFFTNIFQRGWNHQPDNIESSFKNQLQKTEMIDQWSLVGFNLPKIGVLSSGGPFSPHSVGVGIT